MAKGTGGGVADFLVSVHEPERNIGSRPLRILNFHYRIFSPLWL